MQENQGDSTEKRLLLAVVLCLLILFGYQSYMQKQEERWRTAQGTGEAGLVQEEPAVPDALPEGSVPVRSRDAGHPGLDGEGAGAAQGQPVECAEVVVDTPLYRAVFCSGNGRPVQWKLKRYRVHKPCRCTVPGLGRERGSPGEERGPETWVERIHAENPREYPLALEISTGRDGRVPVLEGLRPDRDYLELREGDEPDRVVFEGRDARGRLIRRVYTFSPDTYLVHLDVEIQGLEPEYRKAGLALKLTDRIQGKDRDRYTFSGFMGVVEGRLEKEKKLKPGDVRYYHGRISWAGFSDKYFLTSLLPVNNPVSSVNLEQLPSPGEDSQGLFVFRLIYNVQPHLDGDRARFSYALYVGPKDLDILRSTGHLLEKSVDLGWFGFIAKPLLVVLKFFYRYTHNYGIAIIILTVVIKILFHPLTRKQYESMRQMQKLQPKMQAIREKFKNDRERLNREIMALYRTHKINPLGGCWPMLLQIPVFFALYKALLSSIELRHAPFALWIQDLSAKDPCYITPIIMGATMFLQQKMTPVAGDPNQQKMMMFMPVIFTFLFLNFPSGLVLYWLVNNVITIGQQLFAQKRQQ